MKALETIMNVKETGEFILHFPNKVNPGRYKIVIVVEDELLNEELIDSF